LLKIGKRITASADECGWCIKYQLSRPFHSPAELTFLELIHWEGHIYFTILYFVAWSLEKKKVICSGCSSLACNADSTSKLTKISTSSLSHQVIFLNYFLGKINMFLYAKLGVVFDYLCRYSTSI